MLCERWQVAFYAKVDEVARQHRDQRPPEVEFLHGTVLAISGKPVHGRSSACRTFSSKAVVVKGFGRNMGGMRSKLRTMGSSEYPDMNTIGKFGRSRTSR